jgi:hypothetical protein
MVDVVGVAMNAVAEPTRRSKVVKSIPTTLRLGCDMLNRHCVNSENLFAVDTVAAICLENTALAVELELFLFALSHGFSACQK